MGCSEQTFSGLAGIGDLIVTATSMHSRNNRCGMLIGQGKVYVTKNGSALFAFEIGHKPMGDAGVRMICAHSDSPTFRIKPVPEIVSEGGLRKLDVEVYGGAIYPSFQWKLPAP